MAEADVVLVCVGNDDDVRMTTSETGALAAMKPNAILLITSTTSAILAEELQRSSCEASRCSLCGCTSIWWPQAQKNGVLTIMCVVSKS
ncbi:NAD(P)-binding domain-containing protein [Vibrio chagasii]|nr:NAD(P)-binding domain-containing protein [Vibrio chagasii]